MSTLNLEKLFVSDRLCVKALEIPDHQDANAVPAVDPDYVFDLPVLNQVLLYLAHPLHDCLYLSGPSGCGKTSVALQVAARLNWGVEQLTLSGKAETSDLIGHATLRRGELVYEYGPLVKAMRKGEILILNEIDLMPPADLAALNDVLEGRPLIITQNFGETVHPSPFFRVIATANTKGMGDPLGFYNGVRQLNQAFLDRWRFVELGYPACQAERTILSKACPGLDEKLIADLVRLAGEIRRTSMSSTDDHPQLSAPFSTRVLLRIARLLAVCESLGVRRAVETGFAARLPEDEREYVRRLCDDIFGNGEAAEETGREVSPQALKSSEQLKVQGK